MSIDACKEYLKLDTVRGAIGRWSVTAARLSEMGVATNVRIDRALVSIVGVRLLSVFLVQTWYVPDEYWQSLEVAHKEVFSYGELTWEWRNGVRSYLYPTVFAGLYKLLELVGLDIPELLIYLPRVLQALLSATADYAFYNWSGRHKWGFFMIIVQWFWFFTASRTLSNSTETALVILALARYPFNPRQKYDSGWLCHAALSCVIRPSAAVIWVPLCVYDIFTTSEKRLRLILRSYIPIGLSIFGLSTLIDSYMHQGFYFAPWEFFNANIIQGIASFYGVQPWYWYFLIGFPVVLGINLIPFVCGAYEAARDKFAYKTQRILLSMILFALSVYSISPHKEFRFVLPLAPLATYVAQDTLSRWSRKATNLKVYLVFAILLLGNVLPSAYFGLIHQRGPLDAVNILRGIAEKHPNDASFLFLMPCHSTPLYSHLHVNVQTRYLTCEPNFSENPNYKDEAERFFENPEKWFKTEYVNQLVGESGKKSKLPTHLILFDSLTSQIPQALSYYTLKHKVFNAQIVDGRVGENIEIYVRAKKAQSGSAANA